MGRFWLAPRIPRKTSKPGAPVKEPPFPPADAKRFADGGSLRTIFAKPNGPRSNPLTDIRGNGGHYVLRSFEPYRPAIALQGNTLVLNSIAGIASTVFFAGTETLPLIDQELLGVAVGTPVAPTANGT
jgi:hypothetical protein